MSTFDPAVVARSVRASDNNTGPWQAVGLNTTLSMVCHYTLVGPTVTRLVQDPLAVYLLDNQLYTLLNENITTTPLPKPTYIAN